MARPPKSSADRLEQRSGTRFTAAEAEEVAAAARDRGVTISTLIREMTLAALRGVPPRRRPQPPDPAMLRELNIIGSNLNQLSKVANSRGDVDDVALRSIASDLAALRARLQPEVTQP